MKEFVSLTMVTIGIGKRYFLSCSRNGCLEEKIRHQKHECFSYDRQGKN